MMQLVIQVILIGLLCLVAYQDYKFRAVSWILFPILMLGFVAYNFIANPLSDFWNNSLVNLGFLVFLFGMITLYFSVKHRKLVNLSNGFIGWGDILFLVCLGFLFSPLNFILFYLLSLVVIIVGVLVVKIFIKKNTDQIPLAGLQAFMLLLVFLVQLSFPVFQFSTDEWVVNTFMQ